jgi:biopolymer transport protein ExbD
MLMIVLVACGHRAPATHPVDAGPTMTDRLTRALGAGGALPVAARAVAPFAAGELPILVSPRSLLVKSKPIVELRDGDVDPSDKVNGARGIVIGRLVDELQRHGDGAHVAMLIADAHTPYKLILSIVASAGQAGVAKVHVVVRQGADLGVLSLAQDDGKPIRLVATLGREKLTLSDGQQVLLELPRGADRGTDVADGGFDAAKVTAAATAFAKSAPDEHSVLILADDAVSLQALVDLIVALHFDDPRLGRPVGQ